MNKFIIAGLLAAASACAFAQQPVQELKKPSGGVAASSSGKPTTELHGDRAIITKCKLKAGDRKGEELKAYLNRCVEAEKSPEGRIASRCVEKPNLPKDLVQRTKAINECIKKEKEKENLALAGPIKPPTRKPMVCDTPAGRNDPACAKQ